MSNTVSALYYQNMKGASYYGQPLVEYCWHTLPCWHTQKESSTVPLNKENEEKKEETAKINENRRKKSTCQDCINANALHEFNEYLRATGQSRKEYIEKYGTKKSVYKVQKMKK